MDARLISSLETLMLNMRVLHAEMERLTRAGAADASPADCLAVVESIRRLYLLGLESLSDVEKRLAREL